MKRILLQLIIPLTNVLIVYAILSNRPTPSSYLEYALDLMEQNSVRKDQVNWDNLRANAFKLAEGAVEISDTYPAISVALTALGDHHSFFLTPDEVNQMQAFTTKDFPAPQGKILDKKLGYIFFAGFASSNPDEINKLADTLQQIIRTLDAEQPCGWIVDLRANTGGNMWPMLAGIGPVLGEGQVGAFLDANGDKTYWYYFNGQSFTSDQADLDGESSLPNDQIAVQVINPYQLSGPTPPVAVLTSNQTASSGEAIVVAFRHRPNTRSFGQATMGLSTANGGFPLADGAMIFLTVATFVDREEEIYGMAISPDEITPVSDKKEVPQEAIDWLMSQPACTLNP